MDDNKRIFFGTLEHLASTAEDKQEQSDFSDDDIDLDELENQENLELTEAQALAKEENALMLKEFERREMARKLAVPTDDEKVKLRLRELGEPICFFAEGPGDRRDRLRQLLSVMEQQKTFSGTLSINDGQKLDFLGRGSAEIDNVNKIHESEIETQTEEFYTEGSTQLFEARKKIAIYSLQRAKERISKSKIETEIPLTILRSQRKDFYDYFSNFDLYASEFADQRPISKIKFSPNSKLLATSSWSGLIKLWNVDTMTSALTLRGHNDRVSSISFNPKSTTTLDANAANLASGGADNMIYLWSLNKQTPLSTLKGHIARVAMVDHHPSGDYLASASYDGSWRLWDLRTCNELLLQEGHAKGVYAVKFQNDGSLVASAGLDAIGRVWDVRTGRSIMTLQGHAREIYSIDWAPNGYQVATGGADNIVCIYDLRTLKQMYTIPAHNSLISEVVYANTSNIVNNKAHGVSTIANSGLITSSFDGSIKIWTTNDYQLVKSFDAHEGKVMGVDISQDNSFIASCGSDRKFKIYSKE
ncbi:hypothetical protein BB561_004627 [Smittium simulii]|uniref:Pre-mRNA processing factor 4 (PRP4)-like domain-containing protein n=1 Tax=Smittium simulii TaxID=133385 RepID=A0A2T9YF88_9FUNG|nr:hypothetical protein BB561_004627 [Smittium simulii]